MLRHVVLVKYRPEATASQIADVEAEFEKLVRANPRVASLDCGPDRGLTGGSSDFAIIIGFDSEDEFRAYLDDPAHHEIAALLGTVAESRAVVDFER